MTIKEEDRLRASGVGQNLMVAILESVITCPSCGHKAHKSMPTDACLFFYDCEACGVRLRPKAGDCCVFCSYGDVPCPPIQQAHASGKSTGCCVR